MATITGRRPMRSEMAGVMNEPTVAEIPSTPISQASDDGVMPLILVR